MSDSTVILEARERGAHRRSLGSHHLGHLRMRERQVERDPVRRHPPEPVRELPQRHLEPLLDSRQRVDRGLQAESPRPDDRAVHQRRVDLWPARRPDREPAVEQRDARLGSDRGGQRCGHGQLMPRADPRADHVAGAEQFDVRAGVGDDPDDDQPVEQQRAEASRVGRRREPPGAAVELEHRRQRRRDGERPLHLVDPAAQVGISLEHPYRPQSGVGVRPASLLEVGRRRQCRATQYLQLEACRGVLRQRHRRVKPVDLLQIRAHELSVERPIWARARPSPGSATSRRSSAAARRSGCRVSGAAWPAARRRR